MQDQIKIQRNKLKAGNPKLKLEEPCTLNNGIAALDKKSTDHYGKLFDREKSKLEIVHFIPASGSGSRMFDALFDFIKNESPGKATLDFVNTFRQQLKNFAFYDQLPDLLKTENVDIKPIIRYLLSDDPGLNFGERPKGLIPFHRHDDMIFDAFQEHVLQAIDISGQPASLHFTVNDKYSAHIRKSLDELSKKKNIDFIATFSTQHTGTDAIAFDAEFEPVKNENGALVKRPSGHGALLHNLQSINADIIFIRNIDNVQHNRCAQKSIETRKALGGIVIEFQARIFELQKSIRDGKNYLQDLKALNTQFDLRMPGKEMADPVFAFDFLERPIRVCGMVKNEGQPGGGPFWIKDDEGYLRRQIVEKSQISNDPEQLKMLEAATHFNPVELVCSTRNFEGKTFSLDAYRNDNLFFIVNKTEKGEPILYVEQPGLWNGSMHKWMTVFYEIDSDCFSPVKTVLDLLNPLHQ